MIKTTLKGALRYGTALALSLSLAGFVNDVSAQTGPVAQTSGGAINQTVFNNNSDSAGFNSMSITPAAVALAGSTAQATFGAGAVLTGQVITTKTMVIITCSATTGFTLPAVQRYEPISVLNRSGGSCLIWPSIGATVETALGTDGSVNAPFTMTTNTDVIFKPMTATRWVQ